MSNEPDFKFQHVSQEEFDTTYKKMPCDRQKTINYWQWNSYVAAINAEETKSSFTLENDKVKDIAVRTSLSDIKKISTFSSKKLYSLHDPSDLHNVHGLRNRLFNTFNKYATILENALRPPVLKNPKQIQIKTKALDQRANINHINDLNKLLLELKQDFKNKDLHEKGDKNNVTLRKLFQMKLICCHKLAIDATKVSSQTMEARIYNPIQDKLKELILIISSLSLITGKYLYGQLYKNKKEGTYDLVAKCRTLISMLDDCGYEDKSTDDQNNANCQTNKLNELTNKAMTRINQITNTNYNRLSMYDQIKPKLGSCYARKWSKNNKITDNTQCLNSKNTFEEETILTKNDIKPDSSVDNLYKLDDVKTVVQQLYSGTILDENLETNKKQFDGERKSEGGKQN